MAQRRKTRLARTQEKEAKKDLFKYVLLTIGLFAFIAFVGLPFIIPRITSLIDQTSGRSGSALNSDDTTPPPPPTLRNIPRYTNASSIEVTGFTEAGATVHIVVNGKGTEVISDAGGSFTTRVDIREGENELSAFAVDQAGNESGKSQSYTITQDTEEPPLEIIKPQDGAIFFGNERSTQIEGQTEAGARVTINDRVAIVNFEGKFAMQVGLSEGGNNFKIVVSDEAGNTTEKNLTVSYSP